MVGIISRVRTPVMNVIDMFLADTMIAESLTYRKFRGQAFSEEEGHNVDTFDESTVTGLRLRHTLRTASASQGNVEKGDQFFLFRLDAIPSGFSMKDKIVDLNDAIFSITAIDRILDLAVTFTVDGS